MNRHSLTAADKNFLNVAVAVLDLDAFDLVELGNDHDTFGDLAGSILSWAFANRHADPAAHSALCKANDARFGSSDGPTVVSKETKFSPNGDATTTTTWSDGSVTVG